MCSIRARTAAADDDRRWAENAEGPSEEADAASVVIAGDAAATTSSPTSPSPTSAAPSAPAPAAPAARGVEVDDAAAQHSGEREALEVVRTSTGRTRQPRKPVHDLAALEAEEQARAARLEAARRQPHRQVPQPPDLTDCGASEPIDGIFDRFTG